MRKVRRANGLSSDGRADLSFARGRLLERGVGLIELGLRDDALVAQAAEADRVGVAYFDDRDVLVLQTRAQRAIIFGRKTWFEWTTEKRFRSTIRRHSAVGMSSGLPFRMTPTLFITMYPQDSVIELRSLKEYLYQWRNVVVSYERFLDVVFEHFVSVYRPVRLRLTLETRARGGISSRLTIDSDWAIRGGKEEFRDWVGMEDSW